MYQAIRNWSVLCAHLGHTLLTHPVFIAVVVAAVIFGLTYSGQHIDVAAETFRRESFAQRYKEFCVHEHYVIPLGRGIYWVTRGSGDYGQYVTSAPAKEE